MKYNPQSQYQTEESPAILDKRSWDSTATFIFFFISRFPLKTVDPFPNFVAVLLPPHLPPYTKLKLREKKNGDTRPTLFVGREDGLDLCELENAQEEQKFPRLLSMIVGNTVWRTSTAQRSFSLRAIASWNKLNEDPKRYEQ